MEYGRKTAGRDRLAALAGHTSTTMSAWLRQRCGPLKSPRVMEPRNGRTRLCGADDDDDDDDDRNPAKRFLYLAWLLGYYDV